MKAEVEKRVWKLAPGIVIDKSISKVSCETNSRDKEKGFLFWSHTEFVSAFLQLATSCVIWHDVAILSNVLIFYFFFFPQLETSRRIHPNHSL